MLILKKVMRIRRAASMIIQMLKCLMHQRARTFIGVQREVPS